MAGHTYETTYEQEREGIVVTSIEVRYTFDVSWGKPAVIHAPPERCHPEEDDEIELAGIEVEESAGEWREATKDEHDTLEGHFATLDTGLLLDSARADRW
tara:strand:- start:4913 stop:5212 length:300 start_codon:yes stop_codon:yes gene_type:complete